MKKLNQNGITLVALVITIIILLILAGITINLTIGEKGIITKAQQAGKNYLNAQEQEEAELAKFENEMDNIIGSGAGSGDMPQDNTPSYKIGTFYYGAGGTVNDIELGFKPSIVIVYKRNSHWNTSGETYTHCPITIPGDAFLFQAGYSYDLDDNGVEIYDTGFKYRDPNVGGYANQNSTLTYIAVK